MGITHLPLSFIFFIFSILHFYIFNICYLRGFHQDLKFSQFLCTWDIIYWLSLWVNILWRKLINFLPFYSHSHFLYIIFLYIFYFLLIFFIIIFWSNTDSCIILYILKKKFILLSSSQPLFCTFLVYYWIMYIFVYFVLSYFCHHFNHYSLFMSGSIWMVPFVLLPCYRVHM